MIEKGLHSDRLPGFRVEVRRLDPVCRSLRQALPFGGFRGYARTLRGHAAGILHQSVSNEALYSIELKRLSSIPELPLRNFIPKMARAPARRNRSNWTKLANAKLIKNQVAPDRPS